MRLTHRLGVALRLQHWLFVVLVVALAGAVGYLTTRYSWQADWTAGHRLSLSSASRKVLAQLHGPVQVRAFARDEQQLRGAIRDLVGKYQRVDPKLRLRFVNPDTAPAQVRKLNITTDGELDIEYDSRHESVTQPTEANMTNALARLAHSSARRVVFISGHGERAPRGQANFDLSEFASQLAQQGFKITAQNLADDPQIPARTALLVVASPQAQLLPGEVKLIEAYVARGGNLLWLHDPGSLHGLAPLAKQLDITFLHGTIVDATSPAFGVSDVRWLVLNDYPATALTRHLDYETLFPDATAVQPGGSEGWRVQPFLKSRGLPRSWLAAGKLAGQIHYDPQAGDKAGPLDIGLTLARPLAAVEKNGGATRQADAKPRGDQRVVVIGDGDFLANAYLGNGGNADLGLNIFNWLTRNDADIDVNVPRAPDLHLALSNSGRILLAAGFLIMLPLLLLVGGGGAWWRRRHR